MGRGDAPRRTGLPHFNCRTSQWLDVAVEAPGERYLVADLGLVGVNPCIRHVRQHLAGEVLADVGSERNVLGVTKGRVGFGFALRVGDDGGFVVVLAYGRPDCFERAALPVWSPQTCEVTP